MTNEASLPRFVVIFSFDPVSKLKHQFDLRGIDQTDFLAPFR